MLINKLSIRHTNKTFLEGPYWGQWEWIHVATILYGPVREFVLAVHCPTQRPYILETTGGTPRDIFDTEPDLMDEIEDFVKTHELLTVKQGMAGPELPFVTHPESKKIISI